METRFPISQMPDSEEELVSGILTPPCWRAAPPQLPANTIRKRAKYLGFIPQQALASPCTPQLTSSTRAPIFLCLILYLHMCLGTGNWEDRKPGSLDGRENTGNILRVLRPPQLCKAQVSHPFSIHTSVPSLTLLMSWTSSLTELNATHISHKTKK